MILEEIINRYHPIKTDKDRASLHTGIKDSYSKLSLDELNRTISSIEGLLTEREESERNDAKDKLTEEAIKMVKEILLAIYSVREEWLLSMINAYNLLKNLADVDSESRAIVLQSLDVQIKETDAIHQNRLFK